VLDTYLDRQKGREGCKNREERYNVYRRPDKEIEEIEEGSSKDSSSKDSSSKDSSSKDSSSKDSSSKDSSSKDSSSKDSSSKDSSSKDSSNTRAIEVVESKSETAQRVF
jgi:ribonuclease E